MPYIPPEVVAKAKEMDLLTYLKNYEPGELVHFGGSTYCTRTHDSLKISNGKWCWFSRGIGGRTALDYLIKVREIPFIEAVEMIVGQAAIKPPAYERTRKRAHRRCCFFHRVTGMQPMPFAIFPGEVLTMRLSISASQPDGFMRAAADTTMSFLWAMTDTEKQDMPICEGLVLISRANVTAVTSGLHSIFRQKTAKCFICLRVPLICFPMPRFAR